MTTHPTTAVMCHRLREGMDAMSDKPVCRWTNAQDDSGWWTAGCSTREKPHEFVFNDEGPVENGFKHCPYCGRRLKEQAATR